MLDFIGILNVIPKTFRIFQGEPGAIPFLLLGSYGSYVLFRLTFIRTIMLKTKHLLRANNRLISFFNGNIVKWVSAMIFSWLKSINYLH